MTCLIEIKNSVFTLFTVLNYVVLVSSTVVEQISNPVVVNGTRRILSGTDAMDTLPYVVYLRPATTEMREKNENWLCGGVIIHEQYILTSAACIEDVKRFYVVAGTHRQATKYLMLNGYRLINIYNNKITKRSHQKGTLPAGEVLHGGLDSRLTGAAYSPNMNMRWIPLNASDECITNGAKRATWKIVPKNYVFDGDDINNIRWMISDIAVVRVDDNFNFKKRIRGCDFIPQKISYNNRSEDLEAPGSIGTIAGWGSVDRFGDVAGKTTANSPNLLESDVILMSKTNCKKSWPERYHYIIDESMICTKDGSATESSQSCVEQGGICKELVYSEEDPTFLARRFVVEPDKLEVHTAAHDKSSRRKEKLNLGGFCENDHGGPLVVGHGPAAVVIGIISACLTTNVTQKCYGPFLYSSVWKNQHLINCAIDRSGSCSKYLRSKGGNIDETKFDWSGYKDSSAKLGQDSAKSRFDFELVDPTPKAKAQTKSKKYYKG